MYTPCSYVVTLHQLLVFVNTERNSRRAATGRSVSRRSSYTTVTEAREQATILTVMTITANPRRIALGLLVLGGLVCHSARDSWARFPLLEDAIPVAAEPVIGQPLPFKAEPQYQIVMSPSRKDSAYVIWVGEILYSVAVDDKGLVSYLSTSHPSFQTPEGLHVGSSLAEAGAAGAGEFAPDHGWACFARLPSGWWAGSLLADPPQTCDSRIAWFFKGWR